MKIRFKILCCDCGCSFELESEKFKEREALTCPNCGQPFPKRESSQLRQVISGIQSISEICAASSEEKGFQISVVFAGNACDNNLPL